MMDASKKREMLGILYRALNQYYPEDRSPEQQQEYEAAVDLLDRMADRELQSDGSAWVVPEQEEGHGGE